MTIHKFFHGWPTLVVVLAISLSLLCPLGDAVAQDSDDAKEPPSTEQSIYIPYKKLREVFEREGRGVFLPYEEFQALWRAAHERTGPDDADEPPVDALITETSNEATVRHDVVTVNATVHIELLRDGWNEVPLRLDDAAITGATIDDEPARLLFTAGRGYSLLYEKAEAAPVALELKLTYAKSYNRAPGRNSVSFNAPQAPISRWRVAIPEEGVKVNLRPLIAATDVPAQTEPDLEGDWSVVLAFVGAAPSVGIDWTPKSEGATGLGALADVVSEQRVWIDEGVARTRVDLAYEISRTELPALTIEVPVGEKVVDVSDANVRQWSVERFEQREPPVQVITIELFEPIKGQQKVRVELERFTSEASEIQLSVPVVRALEAARQQGVVVVRSAAALAAQVRRSTGLIQVDSGELPPSLASSPWDFSYRYSSVPFDLALDVEKIKPSITAEALVSARLSPERLSLDYLVVYDVRRAGVFELDLEVPAGYDVRQVSGRAAPGATAVEVDAHHLSGDDETHLTVSLSRKAMGKVALRMLLVRSLDHAELITPSEASAEIELLVPRVTGASIKRESGRLVVFAPESLRVNPKTTNGLRSVSPTEALQGMVADPSQRKVEQRAMLAYVYAQDPASLTLAVQRRRPYVTVSQLLATTIEPGLVRYDATLFVDVKYSGIKSLRLDVPAEVSGDLRNTTAGVRDEVITPAPDDVEPGYVAWRFTGDREFVGQRQLTLTWERPLEDLDVGKSVDLVVPRLVPVAVDRAWGQVVIIKSETVDVHESGEPSGVRGIDPQHDLMPSVSFPNAARAFEFQDEWALTITATHYELEEVKRTSIERALMRMVQTRSGQVTVQALYRMRSARQRLAVTLPDGVEFDTQPLRINGAAATLERGKPGEYFIPLPGVGPKEAFLLELRYVRSDPALPFEAPVFPDEPAAQRAYSSVHLPRNLDLIGTPGPWNPDMSWREDGWLDWRPVPRLSDRELINWVSEGVNIAGDPASGLQADGRAYLFTTLRPAAGADATLAPKTINRTLLSVLVFGIIVGLGLVLARARASWRVVAVGLLVVVLVIAGVFLPTLSLQIMDRGLLAAVVIVAVLWTAHYLVRVRPNDPLVIARREAKIEAARAKKAAALMAMTPASPVGTGPLPPTPGGAGSDSEEGASNDG
ncbi:MAG: hypothetical protein GY715_01470 [Planctomycetes bacterium]|nr:hypothetical protein [Planctomycetota bacterium]